LADSFDVTTWVTKVNLKSGEVEFDLEAFERARGVCNSTPPWSAARSHAALVAASAAAARPLNELTDFVMVNGVDAVESLAPPLYTPAIIEQLLEEHSLQQVEV
jgi:hypothetical protein